MSKTPELEGVSGLRKAAILITLLGEEAAARIFRLLSEEDLQAVTTEIYRLGTISKELSLKVLEEYHQLAQAQDHLAQG
jgi:flagellar motor switch protein FliG